MTSPNISESASVGGNMINTPSSLRDMAEIAIISGIQRRQIGRRESGLAALTLTFSSDANAPEIMVSTSFPPLDTMDYVLDPADSLPQFDSATFGNEGIA